MYMYIYRWRNRRRVQRSTDALADSLNCFSAPKKAIQKFLIRKPSSSFFGDSIPQLPYLASVSDERQNASCNTTWRQKCANKESTKFLSIVETGMPVWVGCCWPQAHVHHRKIHNTTFSLAT